MLPQFLQRLLIFKSKIYIYMSKPLTRAEQIAKMLNPTGGVYKPEVTLVHAEQRPRSNHRTTKPLSLREKKKKERKKTTTKQSSLKQKSENIPVAVRKPTSRLAKPGLTKYPRASVSYTSGLNQLVKTDTSSQVGRMWPSTKESVSPKDMMRRTRRNRGGKRRKTRKKRKRRKTRKKIKKRKRRKTRKRKRRGGLAAGFQGEQSCGEVRQHPMFTDCCELDMVAYRRQFERTVRRLTRERDAAINDARRPQQQPEQKQPHYINYNSR